MATFTNQATLTYNGAVAMSNIVTGELTEALTVNKTASGESYGPGKRMTYSVAIRNTGNTDYTGLTVTDDLGAYGFNALTVTPLEYENGSLLYYINGALQTAPAVTAGPPLTITGINVPAGGDAVLIYVARTNDYAPPLTGGSITNTVSVTGGGLASPVTAQETVTASEEAMLNITKAINPTTVVGKEPLTYTFTISNTGSSAITAADNASVTDTFEPRLNITSVTFNGTAWTSPANYTYNAATGEFATVPGQITVPAATYSQNATTGRWSVTPGVSVLTVTGTI